MAFQEEKTEKQQTQAAHDAYFTLPDGRTQHVPLLTIVPVPFLGIKEVGIEFKAEISSMPRSEKKDGEEQPSQETP